MSQERAFCISSYMLVELYNQLRNQALFQKPYSAQKAAATCLHYKNNANWGYVDYEPDVDGDLWRFAANPDFARRKIYDARMAITLRRYGVAEFATTNIKDFEGFGFQKLWNPLKD
ncbi:MAG: VapC toxin family PIN domain ribonuclease [Bdellovibrionales bacterium]